MSLKDKLAEDLKAAMRAKDSVRLDAIRSVRAAITLREVDKQKDLGDDEVIELIRTLRKQKLEAIELFQQGGRTDLVDRENQEKVLLEAYLPQAPSKEAMEQALNKIIADLGASTPKDMGRVMQAAKEQLPGVDGKQLSELVRGLLTAR
jgi:uncharacterized protein YqeY